MVTEPPLMAVVPPAFVVRLAMLTVPPSVVVPVLLAFRSNAPLTAPARFRLPVPAARVVFAPRTMELL